MPLVHTVFICVITLNMMADLSASLKVLKVGIILLAIVPSTIFFFLQKGI